MLQIVGQNLMGGQHLAQGLDHTSARQLGLPEKATGPPFQEFNHRHGVLAILRYDFAPGSDQALEPPVPARTAAGYGGFSGIGLSARSS